MLEMRITGTPPRKHFLTPAGVGPEGHLVFSTKGIFLYVSGVTPFRTANYTEAFKDEPKCSFSLFSTHASINPVTTNGIARGKEDLLNCKYTIN